MDQGSILVDGQEVSRIGVRSKSVRGGFSGRSA